ncbi:MAG: hypothetical protein AAF515_17155 [Pseudomonadota bacterium]
MNHSQDESSPKSDDPAPTRAAPADRPLVGNLPSMSVLRFSGRDCAAFLQGYLTCDTAKLDQQQACPGALCNLQGRVVANGWVWGEATEINMLVSADVTDVVGAYIEPYRRFSRTKLLDPVRALAVAPGTADAVALDAQRALRLISAAADAERADATRLWETLALAAHEVRIGAATSGQFLPQMLGLVEAGAIDFDKGCYLGQEVVARAQHRGSVKRRLYAARLAGEGAAELRPGDELCDTRDRWAATLINLLPEADNRSRALLVAGRDLAGTTVSWQHPTAQGTATTIEVELS